MFNVSDPLTSGGLVTGPATMALLNEMDTVVLAIFTSLTQSAVKGAASSVQKILQVSSQFLSGESHDALKNFHDLYFNAGSKASTEVNDDVSRIFDEATAIVASGTDVEANLGKIGGDKDREQARLAISGLQKKLESVIAMEANFREKVGPILASMQFEDAMVQRVAHLEQAWTMIIGALATPNPSFEEIAKLIDQSLTSAAERTAFYAKVLNEEPPTQIEERSVWLDFAA